MTRNSVTAVAALIAGTGCTIAPPGSTDTQHQNELNANRAKWTVADLGDYEYVFTNSCFCPPEITTPLVITVQNGAVIANANATAESFQPLFVMDPP